MRWLTQELNTRRDNLENIDVKNIESQIPDDGHLIQRILSNKKAVFGGIIVLLLFLMAIFAPIIAPHDYITMNLPNMLKAPSGEHIFGTDEFGRDIFSRIVYGARISLQVGFIAVGISLVIGTVLGAIAGYYGGIVDYIISSITDIAWALPVSLLAIALVAALGPSLNNLILAVSLVSWSGFARLVRGQFLTLREKEFVEAAKALGYSDSRIIFRHILPNAVAPIIVLTTLEVPKAIIIEASLSFLGLGAQPPTPSWGSIMNSGKDFILEAPWISIFPGLMIMIIVLGFNLFGDALRDILDPRLKN